MAARRRDIVIAWFVVHGGSFHKLIRLHELLRAEGLDSLLLFCTDPPQGLQPGLDLTRQAEERLRADDVLFLGRREMLETIRTTPADLFIFDAHRDPVLTEAVNLARREHRAKTAQTCTVLADFVSHGADYLLVQHPMTLWWELDFHHTPESVRLATARGIFFAGNIFFEPVVNVWTTEVRDRAGFFAKYGLDPALPLAAWLPDRDDGLHESYGQVLAAVRAVPMNAVVKLHPWEYKSITHGFPNHFGPGRTSADRWGVPAVEERDGSWCLSLCDLGILRGSAMGIELCVWRKPSLFIPPEKKLRYWSDLYFDMLKTCAARVEDARDLTAFLARNWPLRFPESAYAEAMQSFLTEPETDAYTLHLRAIRRMLDSPLPERPLGNVRDLYLGRIPLRRLKRRHWPEHLLRRLGLALRGRGPRY